MRKVVETRPGRIAYYDLSPAQWEAGIAKLGDGSLPLSYESTEEDPTFIKLAVNSPDEPSAQQIEEFEAALNAA